VVYRNLDDPLGHYGTALLRFLEQAGIAVEGRMRPGVTPDEAALLLTHESKPLSLIVRDLGKFSNNFVAETLLKALAVQESGPPGTTAAGARVLERYLASVGADSGSYRIVDGSGFSRSDRLSARTITRVIRRGLLDFETAYELAASLSVSGTDGTLEDRMGYPGLSGSVRAKTGLLDGVTAISGILKTASGDEVLFSILVNGFECEAWKVHDFEHAILTTIAGWSAGG
jgi:D-alanyl-D-alanine carboxypeptidase/D-alanyl-D-alanine-endopeptidase (penicillin-binding protein 4)